MAKRDRLKGYEIPPKEGRPTKFTPERRAAIIDAIYHRIPYVLAAEANGISEETFYDWLRTAAAHLNEGIESDFTQFSESIKRAEMQRIREHNEIIAARPERWQADAWLLERRWNKHYSQHSLLNELNERLARLESLDKKNDSSSEEDEQEN